MVLFMLGSPAAIMNAVIINHVPSTQQSTTSDISRMTMTVYVVELELTIMLPTDDNCYANCWFK